jgi:hypothetical protein
VARTVVLPAVLPSTIMPEWTRSAPATVARAPAETKHCTLKPTNFEFDPIGVLPTAVDGCGSNPSETR